jgi:hypothetical protein
MDTPGPDAADAAGLAGLFLEGGESQYVFSADELTELLAAVEQRALGDHGAAGAEALLPELLPTTASGWENAQLPGELPLQVTRLGAIQACSESRPRRQRRAAPYARLARIEP